MLKAYRPLNDTEVLMDGAECFEVSTWTQAEGGASGSY